MFAYLFVTSLPCLQTGTLTEDGLDMWGIVPCTNGILGEAETNIPKLENHPLFEGMLVCHSLTLIDNKLCGDPLDAKVRHVVRSVCFAITRYNLLDIADV